MQKYIQFADALSAWFGKAFAWLIILMTVGMSYEVMVRYLFNRPTPWALDISFMMYGTLFMMGGAYTLSRGGHVRGDFLYRLWSDRTMTCSRSNAIGSGEAGSITIGPYSPSCSWPPEWLWYQ